MAQTPQEKFVSQQIRPLAAALASIYWAGDRAEQQFQLLGGLEFIPDKVDVIIQDGGAESELPEISGATVHQILLVCSKLNDMLRMDDGQDAQLIVQLTT